MHVPSGGLQLKAITLAVAGPSELRRRRAITSHIFVSVHEAFLVPSAEYVVNARRSSLHDTKDANGLDWYVEGPGRRVGYDDLTAIDWIFEYAKERQRLRYLYASASGIIGSIKQLVDASQIWLILIAAGILSGGIAVHRQDTHANDCTTQAAG